MTRERKQFQRTEDGHLRLMSNEERNLLITDLTARLNYGVICLIERVDDFGPIHRDEKLTGFSFDDRGGFYFDVGGGLDISYAEKIMPYLRPMSSMTEEEKEYIKNRWCYEDWGDIYNFLNHYQIDAGDAYSFTDWLNEHHFDYRGLIEKGLALEAPVDMYRND